MLDMTSADGPEQQILGYLKGHGLAGDTVEGIAKWWLMRHRVEESVLLIKRTLEVLKTKGIILERRLPDGNCLYSLNHLGIKDLEEWGANANQLLCERIQTLPGEVS